MCRVENAEEVLYVDDGVLLPEVARQRLLVDG
jgi:hypothetical protein